MAAAAELMECAHLVRAAVRPEGLHFLRPVLAEQA